MTTIDTSIWIRRRNTIIRRRYGIRGRPKERILIVCEGKTTEPLYFESFRLPTLEVIIIGEGANTDSLVTKTIEHKKEAAKQGEKFQQVWCVFDRDSFSAHSFNRALKLAENGGIKVAYSNEAFELWYVLHFEYLNVATPRDMLIKRLCNHLKRRYRKNEKGIYLELEPRQNRAIKNAKKLISTYTVHNPEKDNPSTNVYMLVEVLNSLKS